MRAVIQAVAVLLLMATPASAGGQCAGRDQVVQTLAARYGEGRQSVGLAPNGVLMEVWASRVTGTWTITVTLPTGMTCLVASGQDFETVAEGLPPNL